MQRWLDGLRASGGINLEEAALTRRLRRGEVPLERLVLAASLGHDTAALVAGVSDPEVVLHGAGADLRLAPGRRACIGRGPHNDLRLDDGRVSSLHCTLERRGAASVQVRDLGSRNGSRLNGQRFEGKVLAHAGDELSLGQTAPLWFEVRWPGVPSLDLPDVAADREWLPSLELSPPLLEDMVTNFDDDGDWRAAHVHARADPWCGLVDVLGAEAGVRVAVAAARVVASTWERHFADERALLAWVPASVAATEAWLSCPCDAHLEAVLGHDDPFGRREPPVGLPQRGGVHRRGSLDRRAAAYVAMVGPRELVEARSPDDPWRHVRALRRALNAAAFCVGAARVLRALRESVAPWALGYGDARAELAVRSA